MHDLLRGVAILGRAATIIARRPKLFVLGALPPVITSVAFVAIIIVLATQLGTITDWLTPFADGWAPTTSQTLRVILGAALIIAAIVIMVISFTAITLTLGFPLYDKISELVEVELGDPPQGLEEPVLRGALRGAGQSIVTVAASVLGSVLLALLGLIPVAGQVLAPAGSLLLGGWMLALELLAAPAQRRGLTRIGQRRALLRRHRGLVLGFAVPAFALMAIPVVAIVVFPIATAGGTILFRELQER